jgi:UDP-glucuronate decarboxylase
MTYLVAGGAGFLGSNFAAKLVSLGKKVIVLDNFSSGSNENISWLRESFGKGLEFMPTDIRYLSDFDRKLEGIFNFACIASPPKYQEKGIETLETNFTGTKNLLDIAKNQGITYFHSSTSEVYGDPSISPQSEDYFGNVNPFGVRSCYDEGKRVAESLMFEYQKNFKTKIRIARIFNTYGPRMSPFDGRVVSNFIVQALTNQDITIYGDGNQTRSFCYVSDLMEGIMKLFESSTEGPTNLGNPAELKVNQIALKILNLIPNSQSKLIYVPLPTDDPQQRKPDISKAQEMLEWSPVVSLENGLIETIDYFSTVLKIDRTI